jgi:hypothetical protein
MTKLCPDDAEKRQGIHVGSIAVLYLRGHRRPNIAHVKSVNGSRRVNTQLYICPDLEEVN